jgi:organic radical activating enzyme
MTDKAKVYTYSEIFKSIQGEGEHTGKLTAWLRLFGCNAECQGFSQKNPRDPSTWVREVDDLDLTKFTRMEDIPVLKYGCDSGYSWSKKYRHLAHKGTAKDMYDKLVALLANERNPNGRFIHPNGQDFHLALTGGEPMMSQSAIVDLFDVMFNNDNYPINVTVETNGTQKIRDPLNDLIGEIHRYLGSGDTGFKWFWSVSPKLGTSGEAFDKMIKPDVVAEYSHISDYGQLKYVVDGTAETWEEVERATALYRQAGVQWPVWIMPVGASSEQQRDDQIGQIADEAIERGYNVAARVHCYLWNNPVGK